jgi:hypothetical protein
MEDTASELGDQVAHTTRRLWRLVFVSTTLQLVPVVVFQVALDWILEIVATAGNADSRSTDRKHFLTAHLGVVAAFPNSLEGTATHGKCYSLSEGEPSNYEETCSIEQVAVGFKLEWGDTPKDRYVVRLPLGNDLKNGAAAVRRVTATISAVRCRPIEVTRGVHDQTCERNRSIRPTAEAVQDALLAARIQLEDSPAADPCAIPGRATEDRGSLQISSCVPD